MRFLRIMSLSLALLLRVGACSQVAPAYTKFGFDKPVEKKIKVAAVRTKRRAVRVNPPVYNTSKTFSAKPRRFILPLTFLNEHLEPLKVYPRIRYEVVQGTASRKNRVVESNFLLVDASGRASLAVTIKDARFQAGVVFLLADQAYEDPEYELVDVEKAAVSLPISSKSSPAVQTLKPLLFKIKRNFADLTVKGVPPGCRVFVAGDECPVRRLGENNDRVQISLPVDIAANRDLQLSLLLSDDQLERRATVDAGELLAQSGSPVSAYGLNSFEVPDEDWVITRIGFQGVPLVDLKPSFGRAQELALFTADQVVTALGKPDKVEPSYTFSKPDGSEWMHYSSQGLSFKVRKVSASPEQSQKVVELVRLVSPKAGKIGGIGVGDSGDLLYHRLGKGQLSELFGKPRANYRAYLSQGLQYSVDASTLLVASIEAWRPFPLLMDAVVPKKMPVRNKVKIEMSEGIAVPLDGEIAKAWAAKVPAIGSLASQTLRNAAALRPTENPLDADAILGISFKSLVRQGPKVVIRGTLSLSKADFRKEADFAAEADGSPMLDWSASSLAHSIAEQAVAFLNRHLDSLSRLDSIDYLSGDLHLGIGRRDGIEPGFVFDPVNLDAEAFPEPVDLSQAKTRLPKELSKAGKARMVMVCTKATDSDSVGRLAYLVAGDGSQPDGVIPLDKEDWQTAIRRLLDPGTGLMYVRLRLIARISEP